MSVDVNSSIFTQLHKRLLAILSEWPAYAEVVKVRNSVDITADDFEAPNDNLDPDALPELIILQSQFSQEEFTVSDPAVGRTIMYPIVVTGRDLRPNEVNFVVEQVLEAFIQQGQSLQMPIVNGNKVLGWSLSGISSWTPDTSTGVQQNEQPQVRFQSIATVAVRLNKTLSARRPI